MYQSTPLVVGKQPEYKYVCVCSTVEVVQHCWGISIISTLGGYYQYIGGFLVTLGGYHQ